MPQPRIRFLIIGMARSGTTITHQAVQGHPNIMSCMDELKVAPFFTQGVSVFTVSGRNNFERDNSYGMLIDAVTLFPTESRGPNVLGYGGMADCPKGEVLANGVKVAIDEVKDADDLVTAMQKYDSLKAVKVIRVNRRDLVAQCASLDRAWRTGRWHSFHTQAPAVPNPEAPFKISEKVFGQYVDRAVGIRAAFDRLALTHSVIELSYEDEIAALGPAAFERVFRFLGVPPVTPSWIHSQKVAPPVSDYLLNADHLYSIVDDLVARKR
jgi:hypothetical protein